MKGQLFMKDFKNINFELIDINVNSTPDLFINRATITFSKKVLEDMNYPANVQYCISPENRVFAIRACKSNESKPVPFSKPRAEQINTLSTGNKNLVEPIKAMLPEKCKPDQRYKVTGYFDADSRTMFFDMDEVVEDTFRQIKAQ